MNPRSDLDSLFRLNRSKLRSVFSHHFPDKEGKIAYSEFVQFCKNAQILPDLVTVLEVKRLFERVTQSLQSGLSYLQFESTLKQMATTAFHSAIPWEDKQRMILLHIQTPCLQHYQVALTCSHLSDQTSDSEDAVQNSRNSLGTSVHTAQTKESVGKKTLKVTLNLSNAHLKSPSNHLSQKYFSMSPDPELQESLRLLTSSTGGNAQKPELPPPANPHSAPVHVKLPISPRPNASKVQLFHVTLDKQKIKSIRKETVLAGYDSRPSFHCEGISAASEESNPSIPQANKALERNFPLAEVKEKIAELQRKLEGWKEFQPKVIGRPLRTVLRKQREFIEETTANWFPGVSHR